MNLFEKLPAHGRSFGGRVWQPPLATVSTPSEASHQGTKFRRSSKRKTLRKFARFDFMAITLTFKSNQITGNFVPEVIRLQSFPPNR